MSKKKKEKRIAKDRKLLAKLSKSTGLSGALLFYAIRFGIRF